MVEFEVGKPPPLPLRHTQIYTQIRHTEAVQQRDRTNSPPIPQLSSEYAARFTRAFFITFPKQRLIGFWHDCWSCQTLIGWPFVVKRIVQR